MDHLSDLDWPTSFARLFLQVLPEELLKKLAGEAEALAQFPNFWLALADLQSSSWASLTAAESAIQQLYHIIFPTLQPAAPDLAGAEWWVQVYEEGRGLDFHFDKDEHLYKAAAAMKQPWKSSVLYLYGSDCFPRLGPTVVVDQVFDAKLSCAAPATPSRSALVFPKQNAYLLFDGRLGHGVLGNFHPGKRATMLVNWWQHQPEGIERINQAQAASLPSGVSSNLLQHADRSSSRHRPFEHAPLQLQLSNDLQHPVLVDEVLTANAVSIVGPHAQHALAISHPHFQLYPLDEDQEGLTSRPAIAAAFVPVDDDSDSDCDSQHGSDADVRALEC